MKTAVIIGVGPINGLGATLCKQFAARGLHVFVAGRTSEKIDAVAQYIEESGGRARAVVTDTTNEEEVRHLFAVAEKEGPISLAIFNAGNNMPGSIENMEASYFEAAWRVGCYGGFLFMREAIRHLAPRGEGTLLVTGASASLRGRPNFGAFAAAKSGLRTLTQSVAREFCPKGIHVSHVVIDGPIDGDRVRELNPVVSDKRELVSVCRYIGWFMQHKAVAIRQVQRRV